MAVLVERACVLEIFVLDYIGFKWFCSELGVFQGTDE